jgi:DNA-binding transcriptional LysR family regulator
MRFEGLDLNLLVALDALIEDRSVSSAARRVFLSQPALSGALNRLRDYFQDDILVPSGRQMILTPKAEELRAPVREALMFIKARITTPSEFDPAEAKRCFSIAVSDYAYDVLVASVIAEAAKVAPGVTFQIEATNDATQERFDRGEIDLFLTLESFVAGAHPSAPLFTDDHAVICWSEGVHRGGISVESFLSAPHSITYFGRERRPAFTETFFSQRGIERNIAVKVPHFSALPFSVIGTDRLATMYRRHATHFASHFPITIHEPPMPMPSVTETVQWHQLRQADEGLNWLIDLVKKKASQLDA